jgi:transposase-like protein
VYVIASLPSFPILFPDSLSRFSFPILFPDSLSRFSFPMNILPMLPGFLCVVTRFSYLLLHSEKLIDALPGQIEALLMDATARKSVHISRLHSPQSREPRARKNLSGDRAGREKSRRPVPDREGFLQRPPLHSDAPNLFPPTHQESVAKQLFNTRFKGLNLEHYSEYTRRLLRRAYPKTCPHCETEMLGNVAGRENALRCTRCHFQASRTAYTPLHHLKLPLWTFGYILSEALQTFPQMISAAQIGRRLGVSHSTSLLLKRRLQLFLSDLVPAIRELLAKDAAAAFSGLKLPENKDISSIIANMPVIHTDTLALFSATQRSNGGRARWRHTGQTASIYLSDKVAEQRGKFQIGTLAHTVAVKKGPILLTSLRDQTQKSIEPVLNFLPRETAIMSDEGTPWLSRYYPNHRAINHSARAKDKKRSKWARNRWSKNGVHNQVAEGNQRMVKMSFLAAYGYFRPEYSQLYLNEYSVLKSIRAVGFDTLLSLSKRPFVANVDDR